MKVFADRFVNQSSSHCRIDSSAQCHDHFPAADLLFECVNSVGNKMRRRPILFAMTNVDEKVVKYFFSFYRMINLRMKLQSIENITGAVLLEGRDRYAFRCGKQFKTIWQFKDCIGMTHPN